MLAFVISVCRREKEINAMRGDLWMRRVGVGRMFRYVDMTGSMFVTGRQMEEFFGEMGNLMVFYYGEDGVIRFSDFVKMLAPLSITLEEMEEGMFEEITVEGFEKASKILKKMREAEVSNFKDLGKIATEFRQKDREQMFRNSLFQKNTLSQE